MPRRRPYRAGFYASPIDLPEGRSGALSIHHRYETGEVDIVGRREAYFNRERPVKARLSAPLKIHELHDADHGVWMSDCPQELNQIARVLHELEPWGRVLVGGLGLGILATILTMDHACDVTVVERSPDVIKLCSSRSSRFEVVQDDIAHYLATCKRPFDYWLLDTWQGTNESTWWTTVMPLRRTIANRFGRQTVWCWAEDQMLGQVEGSAATKAGHGDGWYYQSLPADIDARAFVRTVGSRRWEKTYGAAVDAALAREGN